MAVKNPKVGGEKKDKKGDVAKPKGGYEVLVREAIFDLKERSGSSSQAILKYIAAKYPEYPMDKLKLQVKNSLKRMIAKDDVKMIKASYKLNPKAKAIAAKPPPAPKSTPAKPASKAIKVKPISKTKKSTSSKPKKSISKKVTKKPASKGKASAAKPRKVTKAKAASKGKK